MTDNPLSGLQGALRGELITRNNEEAFASARFRDGTVISADARTPSVSSSLP